MIELSLGGEMKWLVVVLLALLSHSLQVSAGPLEPMKLQISANVDSLVVQYQNDTLPVSASPTVVNESWPTFRLTVEKDGYVPFRAMLPHQPGDYILELDMVSTPALEVIRTENAVLETGYTLPLLVGSACVVLGNILLAEADKPFAEQAPSDAEFELELPYRLWAPSTIDLARKRMNAAKYLVTAGTLAFGYTVTLDFVDRPETEGHGYHRYLYDLEWRREHQLRRAVTAALCLGLGSLTLNYTAHNDIQYEYETPWQVESEKLFPYDKGYLDIDLVMQSSAYALIGMGTVELIRMAMIQLDAPEVLQYIQFRPL